jgi:S1-C subfamily serine protease
MKLPISLQEKTRYKTDLEIKLKKKKLYFFLSLLSVFVAIVLMETVGSEYTKQLNSNSITEPVAFVFTNNATGTAFLTGTKTLLTARHVVEELEIGDKVGIIFKRLNPEVKTMAKLVWKSKGDEIDPITDFAVLKLVDPSILPKNMSVFSIGTSDKIEIGQEIKSIGYPSGLFSVTEGKISNTSLQYPDKEYDLIQLNCNIYPGNSGGPVILTETEEVIGIAELAMKDEFQGINFASKIDKLINLAENDGIDVYE